MKWPGLELGLKTQDARLKQGSVSLIDPLEYAENAEARHAKKDQKKTPFLPNQNAPQNWKIALTSTIKWGFQ